MAKAPTIFPDEPEWTIHSGDLPRESSEPLISEARAKALQAEWLRDHQDPPPGVNILEWEPQPKSLVDLDRDYMATQKKHQREVHLINSQRAARLQSLSDEEVYRQLYEQGQLDASRGKFQGIDQGVLRPQSSPFYPPSNQTPAQQVPVGELPTSQIPRSLMRPELYDKGQMTDSDTQQRHDGVMDMLGSKVPPGPPMLKAAQIMAQASQGAPGKGESKFKRSPVTSENLPASKGEWDIYEKNIDYSKGGHIGDLFGGKFPSHPKGHFGAARTRDGKLVEGAHMGHDTSTPRGTDLPAPSDGILSPYGTGSATSRQGHSLRFYGNDNHAHKFMHMNTPLNIKALAKSLGRELNADGSLNVKRGDIIGQTGNSGWPSKGGKNYAIHLHQETMRLKEGQEHNYTASGLDPGQTRYDHIDPKIWMRHNAMAGATIPGAMRAEASPTEPPLKVDTRSFEESTKPSPDVLNWIANLKKKNAAARAR